MILIFFKIFDDVNHFLKNVIQFHTYRLEDSKELFRNFVLDGFLMNMTFYWILTISNILNDLFVS